MSRALVIGFAVFVAAFGAALWWFQTRAYYETVDGLDHVTVGGHDLPVADYRGIDAVASPLKLRACFRIAPGVAPDALAGFPEAGGADPLVAPGWFDCFQAEALSRSLADGRARAVTAAENEPYGFDRIVALAPSGEGWMWRQINRCGEAKFAGDPLPAGCPPAPES